MCVLGLLLLLFGLRVRQVAANELLVGENPLAAKETGSDFPLLIFLGYLAKIRKLIFSGSSVFIISSVCSLMML